MHEPNRTDNREYFIFLLIDESHETSCYKGNFELVRGWTLDFSVMITKLNNSYTAIWNYKYCSIDIKGRSSYSTIWKKGRKCSGGIGKRELQIEKETRSYIHYPHFYSPP